MTVNRASTVGRPLTLSTDWSRQVGECLVLPCLAALPWRIAWPLMWRMARRGFFFEDGAERAARVASEHGFVDDREAWVFSHRLMRIVDQVDPALAWLRGNRWMDRHVDVDGDPLPDGPCVVIGFHYGAGFWTLRHLRRTGHPVSFVSAPANASQAPGQPLRLKFMRWRLHWIEHAGGAPVIVVGGSSAKIRAALRSGVSILGMVDVPQPSSASVVHVPFLGATGKFSLGLVQLASEERVPVVAYLAHLDRATGRRRLSFRRLPVGTDDPMHSLAAIIDAAVRADPAAWHLWSHWTQFMA